MAVRYLMTWQASTKRWFKKHLGKMFIVSCRQLGVAPTKEASASAANAWWEAKLEEIAKTPQTEEERKADALKVWSMVQDWSQLDESSREQLVDSLVGSGQYQVLKNQAAGVVTSAVKPTPADRTVEAQATLWKQLLQSVCQSGQMSEGRYDGYCRNIGKFVAWIGPETSIEAINEDRLEGFFNHLSSQISAQKFSATYAHTLLMTAKQFISRLAEKKLIPLPGNLRSRRFRFNHSAPTKIETFTIEEVRTLLTTCDGFSEKTKLYLYLMLNCGMYQNDIAELREEEMNWKQGTLTRARSKTRDRNGPVVTYKLWPETLSLLKKYRSTNADLVLTSDEGNPLVRFWLEGGTARRYDIIQSAWTRIAAKMNLKKIRLGMKHLRKTSASLLGQHPQFKFYANYFLADSPRGMADRHYVTPSNEEFFRALDWLREILLGSEVLACVG